MQNRHQANVNALSVDLEDWFCAYNISALIPKERWGQCELRVVHSTTRILDLFERNKVRATFFVLGWIAEQAPDLIREVEARGHEIAVHGYHHTLLTSMTPKEFAEDLEKTLGILQACGITRKPVGYRAPSFTIVKSTLWAFDVLRDHGFAYDSSVFPVGFHPDYGIGDAPLAPYAVGEGFREFPMTCVDVLGRRLPCSGGGYFRMLPYAYTRWCLRRVNEEGRPAVFYFHPWEIDLDQPRMPLPLTKRFRHYVGLAGTERKLSRLLKDFRFTTIREVLGL